MAYIPDEAIDRFNELSKGARLLYVFLARCRNHKTGRCFPSIMTTQSALDISRTTAFALRKELTEKGWATFEGDEAKNLIGFDSPIFRTVSVENIEDNKNQEKIESEKPDSPKNRTTFVENINTSQNSHNRTVRKIGLNQSEKSDSHIRNNQQSINQQREKKADMSNSANLTAAAAPLPADQIREIFTHWQTTLNHPNSKLDEKRKKAIKARLAEGFTVEDLKLAVDGCRASPWHQGANDRSTVYDDLTLICRDAGKVEQFMGYVNGQNGHSATAHLSPALRQTIAAGEKFVARRMAKGEA